MDRAPAFVADTAIGPSGAGVGGWSRLSMFILHAGSRNNGQPATASTRGSLFWKS